jgi:5-methylcytosine-specific restriction enzyme subunit McrC
MPEPKIPIQNLYYLLCYAWDRLEQGGLVDVSGLKSTELVDLFATVLVKGVEHLARRGMEKGYTRFDEDIRGIRGRIDVLTTGRRFLLKHGRAQCAFDELTIETLSNQIIKATLLRLARDREINKENRSAVIRCAANLRDVSTITVSSQSFRKIQLNGNSGSYRFLLNICELIHDAWLPDQNAGRYRFREFVRDEARMALVFQYFIYNFLRRERSDLTICRENIHWKAVSKSDESLSFLPVMQTDISILRPGRRIIVETKYYKDTLSEYYGSESLHSANLYQLLSYLVNVQDADQRVEGILLYPTVNRALNLKYSILGIPVRVQTLDLARPWQEIHNEIMNLPN